MNATNKAGHAWTGEQDNESGTPWFIYRDSQGNLYASKEAPAYRIIMDNARIVQTEDGPAIAPKI